MITNPGGELATHSRGEAFDGGIMEDVSKVITISQVYFTLSNVQSEEPQTRTKHPYLKLQAKQNPSPKKKQNEK